MFLPRRFWGRNRTGTISSQSPAAAQQEYADFCPLDESRASAAVQRRIRTCAGRLRQVKPCCSPGWPGPSLHRRAERVGYRSSACHASVAASAASCAPRQAVGPLGCDRCFGIDLWVAAGPSYPARTMTCTMASGGLARCRGAGMSVDSDG